jgi:hypothetical protein
LALSPPVSNSAKRTASFAGQEGATSEAVAVAGDPITLPVAFDVEVVGRANTLRGQSGHCDNGVCFAMPE